ncbi:MAG: hypothetical protein ACXVDA_25100 [Ktedonobacterales bacterium]
MSGGGIPLAAIPLRDGSQLHITQEGVKIGERFYTLASIQDARQVAPEPETVALRVAGVGLVQFQPARAGDGAVALEALFRLRPDLRPAGFAPQAAPQTPYPPYAQPYPSYPGYPVYPQYPPYPGYMPGQMPMLPPSPPPGFPPPPPPFGMPCAPNPNTMQGEITPIPRDFGQLMGAIFQLYGKRFRSLLLLALCVVLPPMLLWGGVETAGYFASMQTTPPPPPPSSQPTNTCSSLFVTSDNSFVAPSIDILLLAGGVVALVVLLVALFTAWQTATLSLGARDAVLGRPINISASMRGGLRRMLPTLGAQIITGFISAIFLLPGYVLLALALISLFSIDGCVSDTRFTHSIAFFEAYLFSACLALPFGLIINYFFWVRLGFAPYAAATMRLGPGRALAASWRLTRGNWWRTFFVLFLMTLIVGAIGGIVGQVAGLYPPVAFLIVTPAIQVLSAPLLALTYMVLLSDLRLRSEGYTAVTQDARPTGGAEQPPTGAEAPPAAPLTQPGEATQQQQSAPPLG